ncbi:hypothetical protein AMD00_06440 [Viridibacillus arvi]|uniref:GP-PDE domain-containing protein n=1 Tax=Viridibacillus arvi TaxID=263475 RepID=A0A0M0LM33_9BACL|nr:hypothetical protein AMD00_06440 [Viridibacillus arvi]
MPRPLVFAHRGASAYEMENTLNAFKKAVELNADGIELDLQITRDDVPVVTHDLDLRRVTGKRRLVTNVSLAEIKRLRVGKPFTRRYLGQEMLTLDELIAWVKENPIALNIELKESFIDNPFVLEIVIKKCAHLPNVHFSSFFLEVLEHAKKINKRIETALIATRKLNWHQLKNLPYIDAIHANKTWYYKTEYLDACLIAKKKCRFYNITGDEEYLENPHTAVVGWITDFPERVLRVQKKNADN